MTRIHQLLRIPYTVLIAQSMSIILGLHWQCRFSAHLLFEKQNKTAKHRMSVTNTHEVLILIIINTVLLLRSTVL